MTAAWHFLIEMLMAIVYSSAVCVCVLLLTFVVASTAIFPRRRVTFLRHSLASIFPLAYARSVREFRVRVKVARSFSFSRACESFPSSRNSSSERNTCCEEKKFDRIFFFFTFQCLC